MLEKPTPNVPRLLILLLVLCSATCYADLAAEPWPAKLQDLHAARPATVRGFKITVQFSMDQEDSGTGGGMYDLVVRNTRQATKRTLHVQSVGFAAVALYDHWPQLEIWGRAGGGSWSRSLYRATRRGYKRIRTDEFTELESNAKDKTRTAAFPGSTDSLYFVETRLPGPNEDE